MRLYKTDMHGLITRKDEHNVVRRFYDAEVEIAKFALDDILQALTELTIRATYEGMRRVNPYYTVTLPFVGTDFIKHYFRHHAEDILGPVPKETTYGLTYKVIRHPGIWIDIGCDIEEAKIHISLNATDDAKKIIQSRVIGEASKEIIGLTKEEIINKYNDSINSKDIRYYASYGKDKIRYRGFLFEVRFENDIVTKLYDKF